MIITIIDTILYLLGALLTMASRRAGTLDMEEFGTALASINLVLQEVGPVSGPSPCLSLPPSNYIP